MKRRRLVPLDPIKGEKHCADCNGTGRLRNKRECNRCKGTGKLNWLENIFGKDQVTQTLKERSRINKQKRMSVGGGGLN